MAVGAAVSTGIDLQWRPDIMQTGKLHSESRFAMILGIEETPSSLDSRTLDYEQLIVGRIFGME
jgi:hypothetical protein